LIDLRTGHIALNKHLHRLGKSPTMFCPHYPPVIETVYHFLLVCRQFRIEHHFLSNALGRQATSMQYFLTREELFALPHRIRFINSTERLS
ncbi:hypothetical protein DFJ58DRAFT_612202, partial [Suillus subalutaceus]|uniref:uncharacterized protein n=1 Tax=Suillus subalutaceus TaxID=48586 RepID=UPI001B87CC4E